MIPAVVVKYLAGQGAKRGAARWAERRHRSLGFINRVRTVGPDPELITDDHLVHLGVVAHLVRVPVGGDQTLVAHGGRRTLVPELGDSVVPADADQQGVRVG